MSLAHGHPYLAIPGPSTMPDRVLRAMHRGSPNIYEGPLVEMVAGIWPDLRAVAGTTQHVAAYIGNGHAGWEAANSNLFSRGETALVLACGQFGQSWAAHARAMGIEVQVEDFGRQSPADPARLEQILRADREHRIKAVLGVDVTVAASQKGLMTPPGLAFVWFSEAAKQRCGQGDMASPYWRWGPRAEPAEFWQYWDGTAPTHHLFGLREALTMLLHEEGLAQVWARHDALARTVWAAFEAWGAGNPAIALNVGQPDWRGRSVTAARFGGDAATRLRRWCETRAGVTLGIGLGAGTPEDPNADGALRVAHMGHVNAHMTLGVLAVMEAGLKALGIPHGKGALEAAAQVVADRA